MGDGWSGLWLLAVLKPLVLFQRFNNLFSSDYFATDPAGYKAKVVPLL
jgi:hypothetical protein